jgi:hypothetical protein
MLDAAEKTQGIGVRQWKLAGAGLERPLGPEADLEAGLTHTFSGVRDLPITPWLQPISPESLAAKASVADLQERSHPQIHLRGWVGMLSDCSHREQKTSESGPSQLGDVTGESPQRLSQSPIPELVQEAGAGGAPVLVLCHHT